MPATSPSSHTPLLDADTSGHRSVPLRWRVIRDRPRSGARNMALDHALAACLAEGCAVLRLYSWSRPTVSFGRNEPAAARYSETEAERMGIDFVRRPTGGRVVLHDQEVTYAVVAPARTIAPTLRIAYALINDALAAAMKALGAPVEVAGASRTPALDAGSCFQSPSAGEVVLRGKKLVGSAQARVDGALLQHGSILLSDDQTRIDRLRIDTFEDASEPRRAGGAGAGAASLRDALGPVTAERVGDLVAREVRGRFGGDWTEGDYSEQERATAEVLATTRYGTRGWTWRR